jgi:hypothetical protein
MDWPRVWKYVWVHGLIVLIGMAIVLIAYEVWKLIGGV